MYALPVLVGDDGSVMVKGIGGIYAIMSTAEDNCSLLPDAGGKMRCSRFVADDKLAFPDILQKLEKSGLPAAIYWFERGS